MTSDLLDRTRVAPRIALLLLLCAICAELLAAYDSSTGKPVELLFSAGFFALLYGCPALLLRELVRRTCGGWPSLVLLAAAAGLLQAGVIDQSMFTEDYRDLSGYESSFAATRVAWLGVSAYLTQNFVVGHVVYSFCGPVAVVEALHPRTADRPWLGRRGLVLAGAGYLLAAGTVLSGTLTEEQPHAGAAEVTVTLVLVAALAAAALVLARRRPEPPATTGTAPRVRTVLLGSLAAFATYTVAPETWPGFVAAMAAVAAIAVAVTWAGRRAGWGPGHAAAVALGAMLARGLLAFTYDPLIGEVPKAAKYAHNVVMLAVVTAAGWAALRRARDRPREVTR
jgi:hypothetical protein